MMRISVPDSMLRAPAARCSRAPVRAAVLAVVFVASALTGCSRAPDDVVLIAVDSFRADRLHRPFGPRSLTPMLDSLAARGVEFTEARTPSPTLREAAKALLAVDAGGLAAAMKARGYHTAAAVGSIELGRGSGIEMGFEAFDDSMGTEYPVVDPSYAEYADLLFGKERRADATVGSALELAGAAPRRKPLFLFVQLPDPEQPYDPPLPFASDHASFAYDGEIAFVDNEVARLVRGLARLRGRVPFVAFAGLYGEGLGEHGEMTHGFFLYETTIRVPLFFSGRGVERGTIGVPATLADAAATLAALKRAHLGAGAGRDLTAALKGRPVPAVPIISSTNLPKERHGWSALAAVVEGGWKLVRAPAPELYRLADDPGETRNLASEQPETVRRLGMPLESAGYSETALFTGAAGERLPDPKDEIADWNRLQQARLHLRHGRLYEDSGAEEEALAEYDEAVETAPELPDAHVHRGAALLRLERLTEAREAFRRALELDDDLATAWAGVGLLEERAGRLETARAAFDRALEGSRGNTKVLLGVMSFALRTNDFNRAIVAGERLVAARPNDLTYLNDLATLYLHAGRTEESLATSRRALLVNADDPVTQYNLGRALVATGDPAGAATAFERYLQLWPDAPNAEAVRDGIEELRRRAEADTTQAAS